MVLAWAGIALELMVGSFQVPHSVVFTFPLQSSVLSLDLDMVSAFGLVGLIALADGIKLCALL